MSDTHHHTHGHHHNNDVNEQDNEAHKHIIRATPEHEKKIGAHRHGHASHNHAGMIFDFKKRFWISLLLSVPIILFSPMIQQIFGYQLNIPQQQYIAFTLSSFVFFYGGWPFLKGLSDELRNKTPGMMTLIGVAIIVAYAYSSAVVFGLPGMDFFWELVTLIVIMLLGHLLEMRSIAGASKALELLIEMLPAEAYRINKEGKTEKVKTQELQKGDIILIKPGEKVPTDGEIIEGDSYLNESMLTGESKPVRKTIQDMVIGGAINENGALKVKVKNTGKDSYLSRVINLVDQAQKTKSKTQHLANRAALWLTMISLTLGFTTLLIWIMRGEVLAFAIERMVTVMVISCPHALGLAIPLVVAISTSLSAQRGLLIRNRTAFEDSRKITVIVFDKTGTLTKGSHGVSRVISLDKGNSEEEILQLAAGVQQFSDHPISAGIMKRITEKNIPVPQATGFNYLPGKGSEALVENKMVIVAGPNYLKEKNIHVPETDIKTAETVVHVIVNGKVLGLITLADEIREESFDAIKVLHSKGIKTMLLTGDNENVAASVSRELGMDNFMANVLPHQKQEIIKQLQHKGEIVAMTGDGVNDAPALAQADVGIAVGSGTDVAAETADIILVNSNPKDVVSLILFGRATYRKMIQNLFWATGYNLIALPLATGFIPGISISPAIGAVFMSLSTIIVAINAQLLKRQQYNKN